VLRLEVDVPKLLFTFRNETRGTEVKTALVESMFSGSEEWRFSIFIWNSYKYKFLD